MFIATEHHFLSSKGTSGGKMVYKLDLKASKSEFESHWVHLSYGLVQHLSKKLSKVPLLSSKFSKFGILFFYYKFIQNVQLVLHKPSSKTYSWFYTNLHCYIEIPIIGWPTVHTGPHALKSTRAPIIYVFTQPKRLRRIWCMVNF